MPQYLRRALFVSILALVSLGLVTALVLAVRHLREHEVSAESTWFGVPPTDNAIFSGDVASVPSTMLALSPDGRRLAFVASQAGAKPLLWIRELNSMHVEALPGTDNAAYPFWSPDSKRIGYFADGKLHTMLISGRDHEVLCDAPVGRGGTWSEEGIIVFAYGSAGPLYRISEEGGAVTPLTTLDPVRGDHTHRWPHFLPDGQNFLYFTRSSSKAYQGIYTASLQRPTGRLLRTSHTGAIYASGQILFVERGVLKAQLFDPALLQLSGSAQTVARQVGGSTVHYGPMSASNNGRLAYGSSVLPDSQLLWMDRSGSVVGRVGEPGDYTSVQVSPRGDRVAVGLVDPRSSTPDVWVIDLGRIPSATRITRDPDDTDGSPVWSPDSQQLVFRSDRAGANNLYSKASRGQGEDQLIFSSSTSKFPTQWVAGRDLIVYHTQTKRGDWDVEWFALRQRESTSLVSTPANEVHGEISPDGRWLAYASDESGSLQVYVESLARRGERVRGSVRGGTQPRWRGDSRELYYVDENARAMFAVPIHTNGGIQAGSPVKLFDVRTAGLANPFRNHYAVDPTGNRFLVSTLLERPTSPPVTVVLNWLGAIEARGEWPDEQVAPEPQPLKAPSRSWVALFRDPIWQFVGVLFTVATVLVSWVATTIRKIRRSVRAQEPNLTFTVTNHGNSVDSRSLVSVQNAGKNRAERITLTVAGADWWNHPVLASGEHVHAELPVPDPASLLTLEAPDSPAEPSAQLGWRDRYGLAYSLTRALVVTRGEDGSLTLATRDVGQLLRPRLTWKDLWRLRDETDDAQPY